MVLNSVFLALGAVLHQITPPIVLGMKPDFLLAVLLMILVINDDYKSCICAGIVAGLISAATTGFPGGQIPNFLDKIITVNIMFLFLKSLKHIKNNKVKVILNTLIGTIISGSVFLYTASLIAGLPAKFSILFITVVLPASLINCIVGIIMYSSINRAYGNTGRIKNTSKS
jgi:cell shape-determining protein MreD